MNIETAEEYFKERISLRELEQEGRVLEKDIKELEEDQKVLRIIQVLKEY
jgi:hypothetical protein